MRMRGELKNRVRLSITMAPELARRVRAVAKLERATISDVIEGVLVAGIEGAEGMAHAKRDPLVNALIDRLLSPENIERAARIVGEEADDPTLFRERAAKLLNKSRQRR